MYSQVTDRPVSFQGSVVAADPWLDEAELVTMVGWSGPNFTDDCLRDSRGNLVAPETRLRTFPGRAPCWMWLWPSTLMQTLTEECRALCTYPRGNGVARHLLEDRDQLVALTHDWS